jgi:hypothetical protein
MSTFADPGQEEIRKGVFSSNAYIKCSQKRRQRQKKEWLLRMI